MNRGEVRWCQSSKGETRPYLLLTRQVGIDALHSVIAVPATRTVRGIPTEVGLDEDDGMPHASALTLDNTTLLPKTQIGDLICTLGPARMTEVCNALHRAVDC